MINQRGLFGQRFILGVRLVLGMTLDVVKANGVQIAVDDCH